MTIMKEAHLEWFPLHALNQSQSYIPNTSVSELINDRQMTGDSFIPTLHSLSNMFRH